MRYFSPKIEKGRINIAILNKIPSYKLKRAVIFKMVNHMNLHCTCAYTGHCLLLVHPADALKVDEHIVLWKLKPHVVLR